MLNNPRDHVSGAGVTECLAGGEDLIEYEKGCGKCSAPLFLVRTSEVSIKRPWELRDSDLARRFVWEGLLFQCVRQPVPGTVHAILDWSFEAAAEGVPLPPIGFMADMGHLIFGEGTLLTEHETPTDNTPGERFPLPSPLVRQYEDLVLGKIYCDRSFDRGADGLRRYSLPRDRAKGLAFLLDQLLRRAGCQCVCLSPAVIRDLLRLEGTDILKQARASLLENGPVLLADLDAPPTLEAEDHSLSLMESLYRDLIAGVRDLGDVLGVEDVFELEHGTAIAGFGQRIALRQVLSAAAELAKGVPSLPVRPLNRRQEVATNIGHEDTYPIGGFSSISNRGSLESLLHSQLAFMEPGDRPDMFDIKFLRDELLYYSRDENQFLRRRRSFVFAMLPDLGFARVKDPELPWQRIILLLGLLRVAVARLTDWLSEEALLFEFVFLKPSGKDPSLADERELSAMLFREQIANQTVRLSELDTWEEFTELCRQHAHRSLCNAVTLSTVDHRFECENSRITQLRLNAAVPAVSIDESDWRVEKGHNPIEAWSATLVKLLEAWIAG